MRTSHSHPLQIAEVSPGPGMGSIGITFCPGKKQPDAMTGAWDRDLGLDLDAVSAFGAAAIVTLIEGHEIASLGVEGMGEATSRRHMDWLHLPITDVSVPDPEFEQAWQIHGPGLRARLRDGLNVVVHCKGGLGRAGTIAARLLVELGADPADAISKVRAARNGAIETTAQEHYVLGHASVDEPARSTSNEAITDRAIGALLGLAVGDAVGTTLEFKSRDSYPRLTDMVGGGPFRLEPGQWTDDTSMALALADSLLASEDLDPADLMRRFVAWRDKGEYSCTGTCFDIGITVGSALNRWKQTGDPLAGSTDPQSAGNGSLMRLAPVAIRHWRDPQKMSQVATMQSLTTHGAAEAVSACVAYAGVIADAIDGKPRHEVLAPRRADYAGKVARIMAGSWRGKLRHNVESSGYVAQACVSPMEPDERDALVRSLVLEAGRLMEDLSPELALVLPAPQLARSVRIAALLAGADSITSLLRAAHAMSDVRPATQQFPQP